MEWNDLPFRSESEAYLCLDEFTRFYFESWVRISAELHRQGRLLGRFSSIKVV